MCGPESAALEYWPHRLLMQSTVSRALCGYRTFHFSPGPEAAWLTQFISTLGVADCRADTPGLATPAESLTLLYDEYRATKSLVEYLDLQAP